MTPYYEHDGITIYHGDCREVLPHLPKVDLVLTDPPYGVGLLGKRTKRVASLVNEGYSGAFEDTPEYVSGPVVDVVRECIERFSRVVVMPGTRNMYAYPEPREVGCVFNPSGAGLGRWGFICFHPILYYGKDPYLSAGMGHRPNGFQDIAAGDPVTGHPCAKPIRWMEWLIKKASFETDAVLDPFMGSGTTLVAAKRLGRRAIGIEIEQKYCEIAVQRLEAERKPLFDDAGPAQMELV